ncbi:MAG: zinc dependent phospholipase C family protein [Ruminococcus sp.]|nr:zinc dependent phospholipase C family protein [Ruminococcus sp.]MDE6783908.1 zinc dependent phospholipase C family protein [Ruminococcus sp.]
MNLNKSARKLNSIAKKIYEETGGKPSCVHRNLIFRTLVMLRTIEPETVKIFAPLRKVLIPYSKRPDIKGDYENGMGRHYYCAVNTNGRERNPVNSYYKNGAGKYFKSARSMFEEDYTMSLTMYCAGFHEKSAEFLGRAVHMLSDMCCIPHASSMTYFSSGRNFHKAYENLAEAIYPNLVMEQNPTEILDYFRDYSTFADDINKIALETAYQIHDLESEPLEAVQKHLLRTERILAAFLLRFYRDITTHEQKAHYVTTNSGCRLMPKTGRLIIKVTEKGIRFHGVNPSPESDINVTDELFYIAHRHDGQFTLSPANDNEGIVLEVSDNKFIWHKFDPVRGEQLFRL